MNAPLKTASNKIGRITQITGAVIDVQFDGPLPEILNALETDNNGNRLILDTLSFSEESHVEGVIHNTRTKGSPVLPREHTYVVSSDEEVAYSERAIQTRQNRRHSEPHAATQATLGRVRGECALCCLVL